MYFVFECTDAIKSNTSDKLATLVEPHVGPILKGLENPVMYWLNINSSYYDNGILIIAYFIIATVEVTIFKCDWNCLKTQWLLLFY